MYVCTYEHGMWTYRGRGRKQVKARRRAACRSLAGDRRPSGLPADGLLTMDLIDPSLSRRTWKASPVKLSCSSPLVRWSITRWFHARAAARWGNWRLTNSLVQKPERPRPGGCGLGGVEETGSRCSATAALPPSVAVPSPGTSVVQRNAPDWSPSSPTVGKQVGKVGTAWPDPGAPVDRAT